MNDPESLRLMRATHIKRPGTKVEPPIDQLDIRVEPPAGPD
jgi:hypothetical protein